MALKGEGGKSPSSGDCNHDTWKDELEEWLAGCSGCMNPSSNPLHSSCQKLWNNCWESCVKCTLGGDPDAPGLVSIAVCCNACKGYIKDRGSRYALCQKGGFCPKHETYHNYCQQHPSHCGGSPPTPGVDCSIGNGVTSAHCYAL